MEPALKSFLDEISEQDTHVSLEHLVKNDLRSVSIILPEKCVAGQQLQVLECATPSICLPQMRNAVYLLASNMHAAACETRTSSVCGLS